MSWTIPRTWTDTEFVDDDIMNAHIRDNLLALGPHYMLMKSGDQSVTASTTLVNDAHLVLPVLANEVWKFELTLIIQSNTTADFKFGWTVPSGTTMSWSDPLFSSGGATQWMRDGSGAGNQAALLTEVSSGSFNTTANVFGWNALGFIFTSTTTGNVVFQWAQNVASGTTTVKRGSCLEARRGIG
jgi:hypothetical protein